MHPVVGRHGLLRLAASTAAIVGMLVVTTTMVAGFGFLAPSKKLEFGLAIGALWLLFVLAVLALRRAPLRAAVVVIVAGSVLLGIAGMTGPPDTSTDSARYAWDGIVQAAGISPYAHVPASDALASLRPDWLFPHPVAGADGVLRCLQPRTHLITLRPSGDMICTAINRAGVPTIYPPLAEIAFLLVRLVVGASAAYWPLQLLGVLLSVGVTVLLLAGLRRRGLDPRWAALWALNPLVISEAVTNSHIDVLGALLALAAAFWISGGRRWRGGILLGAAIAAKLIPVLAVPALLRRQPWKVVLAAGATFAVLYVPYVLTTGIGVLGYLPGYLNEEGYDDGSRFVLLTAFLPGTVALPVAAVLLAALAVAVVIRTDAERPWLGQVVMIGTTLLLVSPRYPWYALLLIPFIVMSGRWEWMAVPLALGLHVVLTPTVAFRISLLAAAMIIAAGWWLRRRHARRLGDATRTLDASTDTTDTTGGAHGPAADRTGTAR